MATTTTKKQPVNWLFSSENQFVTLQDYRDYIQEIEKSTKMIVAYTASGQSLTAQSYKDRVEKGINQYKNRQVTSLEQLCTELGYDEI